MKNIHGGSVYNSLSYTLSYHLVRSIGSCLLGFKVNGIENINPNGGNFFVINHRHWLEVFLGPMSVTDQHVSGIIKVEALQYPLIGPIFRSWGAIGIDRSGSTSNRSSALGTAVKRLRMGDNILMSGEGRRQTTPIVGDLKPGIAYIAEKSGANTIPVAIKGADTFPRAMLRGGSLSFGEPMPPPQSQIDRVYYLESVRESIQDLYDMAK